jgi:hypothetical protein
LSSLLISLTPSPFQILYIVRNDFAAEFHFDQAHVRDGADGVFLAFGDVGYVSASDIADVPIDHDITNAMPSMIVKISSLTACCWYCRQICPL